MSVFVVLLFVAMAATFVVMMLGIINMARGGEENERKGNKLMQYRVWFQAVALALLAVLLLNKG